MRWPAASPLGAGWGGGGGDHGDDLARERADIVLEE